MGPSITSGASIRSQRKAAIKVIVFQWPCGALATSLRPFGPQPRRCHIRLDPSLVDEHETGWIDAGLMRLPALTFARDVWPILLAAEQAFFLKLNPSSRTKVQTARRSVLIPPSASSAARPRVVNRPEWRR